ncbi:GNAT family N-acetyltransferase [Ascidiimonas aurantiaca]|uniref:GNAT family N-acetyltransferase n=1 Tax=Ascidiimonas aurantiaca TaxID=1685432 RepID=UPI0030EE8605
MEKFPEIETQRLLLNELQFTDIPDIVTYASNKKIADFTLNIPHPYEEKDAVFWLNMAYQGFRNKTQMIFAIRLKKTSRFIGGIGLTLTRAFNRAEMGYWMSEPNWNKGYMSEAAKAVVRFGFEEMDVNKITSSHLSTNPASGRVMQNGGLTYEGTLKEHVCKKEVYHTLLVYGLTKNEYEQKK